MFSVLFLFFCETLDPRSGLPVETVTHLQDITLAFAACKLGCYRIGSEDAR